MCFQEATADATLPQPPAKEMIVRPSPSREAGAYTASYSPTVAGTGLVSIQVCGACRLAYVCVTLTVSLAQVNDAGTWRDICGSPFDVHVVPSALDPERTTVRASELNAAVQTHESTVLVVGHDRFGNRVTEGGVSLFVSCVPPVQAAIYDNRDGTYSVKFRPLVARPHVLSFEIGGQSLFGSPLTIDVQSIAAEGPALQEATAGEESGFSIIAPGRESQSLARPRVVTVESGSAIEREWPVCPSSESPSGYPFTARCSHTQAGRCTIMVLVDGQHVGGSPFRPLIRPAPAVTRNSTAHGAGLSHARIDQTAVFYITPRDAFQNATGGRIELVITPLQEDTTYVSLGSILECTLSSEPQPDGSFLCSYVPKEECMLEITARINGWEVQGSPFEVRVSGLGASPPDCYATGLGLTTARAGIAVREVYVHVRDTADRPVAASQLQATIRGGPYMHEPLEVDSITCVGKGRYGLSYTVPQPGSYSFSICVDGHPIGGSPFKLVVGPGLAASRCVAEGPGLQHSICGELSAFVISVFDENDDPIGLPKRGQELTVDAHCCGLAGSSARVSVQGSVAETSDRSKFTATYQVQLAGPLQLSVQLNNRHITGSPFSLVALASRTTQLVVEAGAIRARRYCTDEEVIFEIRSLDRFSNLTQVDGAMKVVYKSASETGVATILRKDLEKGVYRVSFTPRGWGTYDIAVLLDNMEVRRLQQTRQS